MEWETDHAQVIPRFMQKSKLDLNHFPKFRDMITLIWNIRGARSNDFVPHLISLHQIYNPDIIIIIETKAVEDRVIQVTKHIGFHDCKVVPLWVEKVVFGCYRRIRSLLLIL